MLDVAALQFVGRSISVFLTFNILLCTVYLCWTWLHFEAMTLECFSNPVSNQTWMCNNIVSFGMTILMTRSSHLSKMLLSRSFLVIALEIFPKMEFKASQILLSAHCLAKMNTNSRGINKPRRPTKHVSYFAHRGRLLFYRKKKELVCITL